MEKDPKIFAEGFYFNEPAVNAPDFVIGKISIEVQRFISFLVKNQSGEKMRFNVMRSKKDPKKIYCEIDTYNPEGKAPKSKEEENESQIQYPDNEPEISIDDMPDNF